MLPHHHADLQSAPFQSVPDLLSKTADRARAVVEFLDERRRDFVRAHGLKEGTQRRRRVFEQGWHYLPVAYQAQTRIQSC